MNDHYNPNEVHPALVALRDVLGDIRDAARDIDKVPMFLEGPIVSVKLSSEQQDLMRAQLDAQARTLRGIERMILERYPGVIE